jgi:predicted ribosome quality control (RQC) complex YloA/Tae2 family protein
MGGREGILVFLSSDGLEILVGRTAADNDALTFGRAAQDDFWLHAAGVPGSHVVIRNPERLPRPPRETLKTAAALAAFHSKARAGGQVAVHWTLRRFVHKARGAPAGEVRLERFQSVRARPGEAPSAEPQPSLSGDR